MSFTQWKTICNSCDQSEVTDGRDRKAASLRPTCHITSSERNQDKTQKIFMRRKYLDMKSLFRAVQKNRTSYLENNSDCNDTCYENRLKPLNCDTAFSGANLFFTVVSVGFLRHKFVLALFCLN